MIFSLNPNKDNIAEIKHRYVYFNNDGIITQISSNKDSKCNDMYAIFELSDIIPFIDATYRFSDYVVSKTKNPFEYEIKKKKIEYKSRSVESQFSKIDTCNDADIMLNYYKGVLSFQSSDSIVKNSGVTFGQEVEISGAKEHPFFITVKDRPDFILETVLVSFSDLLVGEKVDVKLNTPYKEIGVYTRPIFNSYTLETAE